MKWHEEVVNSDTKKVAKILAEVLGSDFYLVGGTALALRLGHRISLDLDLFTKHDLGQAERLRLKSQLSEKTSFKVFDEQDGTLHAVLSQTSVSLLKFPYPIIGHLHQKWSQIPIASYEDIAAMKLNAILGRGSKKDFIDLYFLIKKIGLRKIFDSAACKFKDSPNFLMQSAKALVYFDDAELEPMPRMIANVDWDHVRSFFEARVPGFVKRELSGS